MNGVNGLDELEQIRLKIRAQGDIVRKLKENKGNEYELKQAVNVLKAHKRALEQKEMQLMPKDSMFDRTKMEDLLKQRFFYNQSFEIYGGIQGLYDYGPMGCAMKTNLLSAWRQFFILEEHLLEVDCSMLTPEPVLQASGHVSRFTDLMVKDQKTGECFRADHLVESSLETIKNNKKTSVSEKEEIEQIINQIDNYGAKELHEIILKYDIKSPTTMNELTEPQSFNLMFSTFIGPTGQVKGYLRPETAQGIFVNFQRLLQFNQGKLPFGAAQIGSAFRNEISPRSGLIRVREFTMAEIEYFIDPANKDFAKFDEVKSVEMVLYSANEQLNGDKPCVMSIGDAVNSGIVANQTLGYFMARIHLFLVHIGVDPKRVRFRQHMSNEMAHYACDCWDAECHTSYGWIECVGCADRSCYDLGQHAKATGTRLVAEKHLAEPKTVQRCKCIPNKGVLGKVHRGEARSIIQSLADLSLEETKAIKSQLNETGKTCLTVNNKQIDLDKSMVEVQEFEQVLHVEEVVPNVIEPSFGIGRILYVIFEHSFRIREEDEQRSYLSVSPILAPYKCSVLPLMSNPELLTLVRQLSVELTKVGVSHRVDDSSGSIGRRYARTDQIAIPYGITVDYDSINKSPASMTLRDRDTMKQIRVPMDELPLLVFNLSNNSISWTDAQSKYPLFEQQETGKVEKPEPVQEAENIESVSATESEKLQAASNLHNKNRKNKNKKHVGTKEQPTNEKISSCNDVTNTTKVCDYPGNDKNKVTNWSDWGKVIRKHYQTEELKDLKLTQPDVNQFENISQDTCHYSKSSDATDYEYNTTTTYNVSLVENNNLCTPDADSHLKSTSPSSCTTEWPMVAESKSPHHGLFSGGGWSGMKEIKSEKEPELLELHRSVKHDAADGESHANPIFSAPWNNCQFALPDSTMLEPKSTQLSNAVYNAHQDTNDATCLNDQANLHGLFIGSGWSSSKLDTNTTCKLTKKQQKPARRDDEPIDNTKYDKNENLSTKFQNKRPKFDWTAVLSQLPESHLISEQFQLNDDETAKYYLSTESNVKKHELLSLKEHKVDKNDKIEHFVDPHNVDDNRKLSTQNESNLHESENKNLAHTVVKPIEKDNINDKLPCSSTITLNEKSSTQKESNLLESEDKNRPQIVVKPIEKDKIDDKLPCLNTITSKDPRVELELDNQGIQNPIANSNDQYTLSSPSLEQPPLMTIPSSNQQQQLEKYNTPELSPNTVDDFQPKITNTQALSNPQPQSSNTKTKSKNRRKNKRK